jgi:hypothetical protein
MKRFVISVLLVGAGMILICDGVALHYRHVQPHRAKDYGCNMWIMDYGNGDYFLNTTPEGDGRMYHSFQEAEKVGDRFQKMSKCTYDYKGPR